MEFRVQAGVSSMSFALLETLSLIIVSRMAKMSIMGNDLGKLADCSKLVS